MWKYVSKRVTWCVVIILVAAVLIFSLTRCNQDDPENQLTANPIIDLDSSAGVAKTVTGFVTALENGVVFYNEVEFISEGTDRAKELGIENTDNGYEIYDPDAEIKTAAIATNMEFCLQRWTKEKNAIGPVVASQEEFLLELENRYPNGILCTLVLVTPSAPTESGQRQIVAELIERYVP